MSLLVGCPVYDRAWVLNDWFDHVDAWADDVGGVSYVFALTPGTDRTAETIAQRAERATIIEVTEGDHSTDRAWNRPERVITMADTRNRLLKWARHLMRVQPGIEAFLSLDSDILLPEGQATRFIDNLQAKDAVSPLVYLGPGHITNAFVLRAGVYRRVKPCTTPGSASVLCAAVLMSRTVVMDESVAYGYDRRGEDFAWSAAAIEAGYTLGYDFAVQAKHIMDPTQLWTVDRRIGW